MRTLEIKSTYSVKDIKRLCDQAADKRNLQRLRAIILRAQGKTPQEIASILNRTPKTIRAWIKLFNAGGPEMLQYKHTGGRTSKLTAEQEESLRLYLKEPRHESRRLTLKALADRLFEDYGVRLSQQQVNVRIKRFAIENDWKSEEER